MIIWHRVEFTSEEMVFLIAEMLILSEVGMKLVPLLRSSVSSDGSLMEVKLWTLLVVESFSFSCWSRDCRERRLRCSKMRAVFWSHRLIRSCRCKRKLFRLVVRLVIRFLRL